jgi:DNA (cytosine-5)-methyltransferase 1
MTLYPDLSDLTYTLPEILDYFSGFSGIGGFELGLEKAAAAKGITVRCVGYSEIDKNAIATYEDHFDHINFGDTTLIDADALPDFGLYVGGFPCQAFSIAGGRRGFDDTRGTLFFDVARILRAKKPRHFILENVKGLLSHDGGRTFRVIIETLVELGYCVEWQLLNSKDFGIPQNRERVYLVGHLGGLAGPPVFPFAHQGSRYSTVGQSTETSIARTLTAGGNSGGNHSGMTILRTPEGDRRLTNIETERLQGFPDGWGKNRKNSPRYKGIGNAVCVPVVTAIAIRLLEVAA